MKAFPSKVTVLLVLILLGVACGSQRGETLPAPGTVVPGDIEELTDAATLVVVAEVEIVRPGRRLGDHGELELVETHLRVREVLKGQPPNGPVLVETEKLGHQYTEFWNDGDEVLAFLTVKDDKASAGRFYRPFSSSTVFLLDGEELRPTVREPDLPLAADIAAMTRGEAVEAIAAGR